MQCTRVDFCENIRSQDMYVICPKIQSTYFVKNRDILDFIVVRFHYTTSLSTIIELGHNKILLMFCEIVFFLK